MNIKITGPITLEQIEVRIRDVVAPFERTYTKEHKWPEVASGAYDDINRISELPYQDEIRRNFYSKISCFGPHDCWVWTGAHLPTGYGIVAVGYGTYMAHRFSYALHRGGIPEGKIIRHKCDYPRCVNPDHLQLGTRRSNARDAAVRGRQKPAQMFCRLTVAERCEIRRMLFEQGEHEVDVAHWFDITVGVVRMVRDMHD